MKKRSLVIGMLLSVSLMTGLSGCGQSEPTNTTVAPPSILETTTEPATTEAPTETDPPYEPTNVSLIMVGDILAHEGVYNSGYFPDGTVNFDHIFANVKDDIQAADIAIVNQEVVLGGKDLGLSGYPCFNSPYELGDALVEAGFNVVCHATNHTLDKGIKGVDNTLEYWKTNHPEINVLGIHDETLTDYSTQEIYVYEQDGFKIAILDYTYGTNGIPVPSSRPYIVNLLDEDRVATDIERAKAISDFIIVCPHWGTEYIYNPDSYQKHWTKFFYDHEVDLVLGTHPHVIEPVEWITSEENPHRMLVYYSLGNFVSNQDRQPRMIGAMAKVTLTRDKISEVDINDEKYTGAKRDDEYVYYISEYGVEPLVTHKLFGPGLITTYRLRDYTEELAAANKINADEPGFTLKVIDDLCKQVFGDLYKSTISE